MNNDCYKYSVRDDTGFRCEGEGGSDPGESSRVSIANVTFDNTNGNADLEFDYYGGTGYFLYPTDPEDPDPLIETGIASAETNIPVQRGGTLTLQFILVDNKCYIGHPSGLAGLYDLKFTGDIKDVEVEINGNSYTYIEISGDGTIIYDPTGEK